MMFGHGEPMAAVRRPAGVYLEEYVEPAQPKQFDPRWPSNRHKLPPLGSGCRKNRHNQRQKGPRNKANGTRLSWPKVEYILLVRLRRISEWLAG